jgi:hypothetical protein
VPEHFRELVNSITVSSLSIFDLDFICLVYRPLDSCPLPFVPIQSLSQLTVRISHDEHFVERTNAGPKTSAIERHDYGPGSGINFDGRERS